MSNARRRVARSGWQGPNRRSTLVQTGHWSAEEIAAMERLNNKLERAGEAITDETLKSEILETPHEELVPISALFECSREAHKRGFAKGLLVGMSAGCGIALAVSAILVLL